MFFSTDSIILSFLKTTSEDISVSDSFDSSRLSCRDISLVSTTCSWLPSWETFWLSLSMLKSSLGRSSNFLSSSSIPSSWDLNEAIWSLYHCVCIEITYFFISSILSSRLETFSFHMFILDSTSSHTWVFSVMLARFVFILSTCCSRLDSFVLMIPEVFSENSASWSSNWFSSIIYVWS